MRIVRVQECAIASILFAPTECKKKYVLVLQSLKVKNIYTPVLTQDLSLPLVEVKIFVTYDDYYEEVTMH